MAAEQAFREGESEFGIHLRYMAAAGQTDTQLPYNNIVALNRHGAVLHYQGREREAPAERRSPARPTAGSATSCAASSTA